MRLIDADALADALFDQRRNYPQWVADVIGDMQEAVVRCKDCKYGEPWGVLIGCGKSRGFGITHNPDWFCADGKRRTEDA